MLVVVDKAQLWAGSQQHPTPCPPACKTPADPVLWHLFQCPRINGIKVHTNKCNRRQVVLDLQIW